MRRTILRVNGFFLVFFGSFQVGLILLGKFASFGPFEKVFGNIMPFATIAFLEAFGLAAFFGVALLAVTSPSAPGLKLRFWHALTASLHLFLGGSNLLFWATFVSLGWQVPGLLATLVHFSFFSLESVCAFRSPPSVFPSKEGSSPSKVPSSS